MKGIRAEEEYYLIGILSGCIVKSYMSVTGKMGWLHGYVNQTLGGVLRNEEDILTLRWHCRRSVLYVEFRKKEKELWQFLQVQQ